jgi:hypothetical protein
MRRVVFFGGRLNGGRMGWGPICEVGDKIRKMEFSHSHQQFSNLRFLCM